MKPIVQRFPQKRKAPGLQAVEQERDVLKVEDGFFPRDAFRQDSPGFMRRERIPRREHDELQVSGPFHLDCDYGTVGQLAA